jgi:hypothetical protein
MTKPSGSPSAAGLVLLLCATLGTPLEAQADQEKYEEVDSLGWLRGRQAGQGRVVRHTAAEALKDREDDGED